MSNSGFFLIGRNFISLPHIFYEMGSTISQCVNRNPARIVLLGLDASGKTTILYKFLRASESIETFPTVGFNKEQITYKHFSMLFWDFGGKMIVK